MEFQVQKEELLQNTLQRIYKRNSTMPGQGLLISLSYPPKKKETLQMNTTSGNTGAAIVLAVLLLFAGTDSPASAQGKPTPLKIGTYDSRVVTFAYSRSAYFREYQATLHSRYEAAKQANDTAKMNELQVQGMTYQHLLHQRVFGSGSITSVIDLVKDQLPALAKTAGVSLVVSQWEISYQGSGVELTDLTDQVAQLFKPTEDISKMAAEIRKTAPVPLEQLTIEDEKY
jgi:hypothetical protein